MIQPQLVEYVTSQTKAGISHDAIRAALLGVGWQAADVDDSLKAAGETKPAMPAVAAQVASSPMAASPSITTAAVAQPMKAAQPMGQMVMGMPLGAAGQPASMGARPAGSSFSPMDIVGTGSKTERLGVTPAKPIAAGPTTPISAVRPMAVSQPMQPAKMSDFTPGGPAMGTMAGKMEKFGSSPSFNPVAAVSSGMSSGNSMGGSNHAGSRIGMVIETVALIAFAVLAGYFYMQNASLTSKVNVVNSTGGAQAVALQTQVQSLTSSNASLQGQATALTTQTAELQTELSFFAVSSGSSAAASGTVTGVLIMPAGAKIFSIRTANNAVIFIKNSTDPLVSAALKPLVGASVTLGGSYVPGSDSLSVMTVNSQPVDVPPAASVSAATSSATTTNAMPAVGVMATSTASGTAH